ncbi:MAG TPA: Ig-like domain-containing protein [Nevskiaceae bacterium]|nr:Ig-like domain-containing protein [Nevskiaceae bacterium]
MVYQKTDRIKSTLTRGFVLLSAPLLVGAWLVTVASPARVSAAACTTPSTDYGSATSTVNISNTGTYRVWSRIMAPDATNNSYLIEIDGTSCYTVGDFAIPANAWTWVNYQNGNTASPIDISLTAGSHTVKFIGREPNVKLDRTMFVSDLSCTPTGTGDNCAVNDTSAPTVKITAPTDGATVTGMVNVNATATDESGGSGVSKVEFYVNNAIKSSDTAAPYSYSWDASAVANGTYSLTAKAYDVAGNISSTAISVAVKNTDTQAPTVPTNVTAKADAFNKVTLTWKASTDNVGVSSYAILRNGSPLSPVLGTVTTFADTTVQASTAYQYQVIALDAANNSSAASTAASVTTPANTTADTQPPSAPSNLTATAISASQINLSWSPSTDNVGVKDYDVYRAAGSGSASKVGTVTPQSVPTGSPVNNILTYGDTGLSASTSYSYYIVAKDAAGNSSTKSTTATATTDATPKPPTNSGSLKGKITDRRRNPIAGAKVTIRANGVKATVTTDAGGNYVLPIVPPGRRDVKITAPGYSKRIITAKITSGSTTTLNVRLFAR